MQLQIEDQLVLFEDTNDELVPGVAMVMRCPWHTPGLTVHKIESNGVSLIVTGNAISGTPLSLQAPFFPLTYDIDMQVRARGVAASNSLLTAVWHAHGSRYAAR